MRSSISRPVHRRRFQVRTILSVALVAAAVLSVTAAYGKRTAGPNAPAAPVKHEHKPPHGGTPVVLGNEAYHLELVRDAATGTLQAYVLDGELENFIRCPAPALELQAVVNGVPEKLVLGAIANSATGETVGDTALFEGHAAWLKTAAEFDGTLREIVIRGTAFRDVKFNFPHGNDKD